ncbi:PEP-CTERM sorting domain-containing protein [Roseibacillus ishigakijimensis]|uniref:PEP-CTERM sorting domain-containing protein n=1 Tax=Roseibacillus ishigakijimensis TaxID=454146 RepID=A0A934RNZ0_9BACT|nr:PEP-CTERM sorting domain-containing protein [Roseibacillus ishigakijimensis]MBK1832464.1 PEP-CTERM sorting domain-containing protein [Roseibacillus ishigakijimensis]
MKLTLTLTAWAAASSLASAATVATTDDLLTIVGTGAKQATLILDFGDALAPDTFAWGYRWDGEASGAEMLLAVAEAVPFLSVSFSGFLSSVSYSQDGSTYTAASSGSDFWGYYLSGGFAGDDDPNNGLVDTPVAIAGGGESLPTDWVFSPSGAEAVAFGDSGRLLSDGAWDVWSFGAYRPDLTLDAAAAAVPEPASGALLLWAATAGLLRRRR